MTSVDLESDPAPAPPSSHVVMRIIDRTVGFLAGASLGGLTMILFVNALSRYLFDHPFGWAEEITTGMLVWITMLGMFLATRRRELITIRVLLRKLSDNTQVVLKVVADLITALVMLHLAWVGYLYVTEFGGDQTAYLRIPKGFYTAALPIGAFGVTLAVLFQIRGARRYVAEASRYDMVLDRDAAPVPEKDSER